MPGDAKTKAHLTEVGVEKQKLKEGEKRLRVPISSFYHMDNQDTVHS